MRGALILNRDRRTKASALRGARLVGGLRAAELEQAEMMRQLGHHETYNVEIAAIEVVSVHGEHHGHQACKYE